MKAVFSEALVSTADYCRIGCRFCFRADRGGHQVLEPGTYARALSRLYELGVRSICLTGGEPTDHPQFRKLVQLTRQFGMGCSTVSAARPGERLERLASAQTLLDHVTISADSRGAMALGRAPRSVLSAASVLERLNIVPSTLHVTFWRVEEQDVSDIADVCRDRHVSVEFSSLALDERLKALIGCNNDAYLCQLESDVALLERSFHLSGTFIRAHTMVRRYAAGTAPRRTCRSQRLYVSAGGSIRRCPYSKEHEVSVFDSRSIIAERVEAMLADPCNTRLECVNICRTV